MHTPAPLPSPTSPFWEPKIEAHRRWLAQFDPGHGVNWERNLKHDVEGALTEVWVREELEARGIAVFPNESLIGVTGGPDFRCLAGTYEFFVEVTCLTSEKAVRRLNPIPVDGGPVQSVNVYGIPNAITSECVTKVKQCSKAAGPVLLAIGCFNAEVGLCGFDRVSMTMVLTGNSSMSWDVSTSDSRLPDAKNVTELRSAAFLKPESGGIGIARSPIAGVWATVIGIEPGLSNGILHPNANHPLDPNVLPGIDFGQVIVDRAAGQIRVEWPPEGPNSF